MKIGENLRTLRKQRGFSVETLVAEFNARGDVSISPSIYYAWESNRRRIYADQLFTLSEILGCSVDELCGRVPCLDAGDLLASLPGYERDTLIRMLTSWTGQRHNLIQSNALYMQLPELRRMNIVNAVLAEYEAAVQSGEIPSKAEYVTVLNAALAIWRKKKDRA